MIRKFTKTFFGCFFSDFVNLEQIIITYEIEFEYVVKISTIAVFSFYKSHLLDSRIKGSKVPS